MTNKQKLVDEFMRAFREQQELSIYKPLPRRVQFRELMSLAEHVVLLPERIGALIISLVLVLRNRSNTSNGPPIPRPPFNAEYLLYLLLRKDEREVVIGDLIESYGQIVERFNRRRADLWFYKQVIWSLLPLLRRALLRIGALVWLGRILRRLVS